jgi:transposase
MRVVYQRCCGMDVHKKSVVACVMTPDGDQTRTFGSTTGQLLELADWLRAEEVTHVAMESTGVYWKPIYNLLEEEFTVWVVNAHHIKAVPGRKTDVKDAEWIADLLRHGLMRPSFIPDRPQRELRELVRYRRSLIQERTREVNRIQKVLEGANIKLASVASDVLGVSGRAMLTALAQGETDPRVLANLAKGQLREKQEELAEALRGVVGPHQRLMLSTQLRHLDYLDQEIGRLDREVAQRLSPFEEELQAVDTVPGIGRRTAETILAEMGTDMSRFATSGHLASWAGVCPGNNQSGGKSKRSPTKKGNLWLKSMLVEAARSAGRTQTYLGAQYRRLAPRIGANRAAMAVAHTITVILYRIINTHQPFVDLGANYFDEHDRQATLRRAIRRIERLGLKVTLEAA